ncbi:MAG TPA: phosphatidate cytidylyltransferase, partial [Myxococcota bacterium]|nr:phosphatidate cytidylyltransferase [Myxococcota bacterium]
LAPAGALLLLTAVLFQPEPMATSIQRAALVALGVVYCAALIPYLAVLRGRPDDSHGLGLCLMALFCTWASDTGAYFAGRTLGRRKLYPKISPSKTVEGGVGGLLTAVAMAFAIRGALHLDLSPLHTGLLGAVSAAFGAVGDLCESMLKRSVGAKDSSKLIPGHGGVLDRFDGVMFAVPAFYIYIALFLGH